MLRIESDPGHKEKPITMKAIIDIQNEISGIIDPVLSSEGEGKLKTSQNNKIRQLRLLIKYLETGATGEVLIKQMKILKREVKILSGRYAEWSKDIQESAVRNMSATGQRRYYNKISGITQKNKQIETINYLLN